MKFRPTKFRGAMFGLAATGVAALMAVVAVAQPSRPSVRAPHAMPRATSEPVVVELFTAQGCSGCPEANRVVEGLAETPGVIALTYAVDYWDYLGWPDTFARPEFARRQDGYRTALRIRNVYTPQVIVDGLREAPGGDAKSVRQVVDAVAAQRGAPPEIEFRQAGDRVGVGSGRVPAGGAEVLAVTYTPGPQTVTVGGGDNRGQTVRHVNVVRSLTRLGAWTGRPALYALPPRSETGDNVVVLVQARDNRRILSAATL